MFRGEVSIHVVVEHVVFDFLDSYQIWEIER
jgi:hypothetical protein